MTKVKIEIKARITGSVLFTHEADGNTLRITLEAAVQARADLAGADLAGANLAGADLAGANLAGANLAGANLAGAKNLPLASDDEIARLDQVREIVLANKARLNMRFWHSHTWNPSHTPEEEQKCGSAHCIAGWLQALSPDENIRQMGADKAGALLAPASSTYMFLTSNTAALQWLRDRGYARHKQATA